MKQVLAEMARLYRDHALHLENWIQGDPDAPFLIERLSDIDGQFFEAAREVGDRVEESRRDIVPSGTLRKAAEISGAIKEFEDASKAVARVSVLHVRAVRQLEVIKREIKSEISKISRTKKVKARYTGDYANKGRKLSGRA